MNAATNGDCDGVSISGSVTPRHEVTIFVDLDRTLIWTWTPLITNAFMSQLVGLPICMPPKPKEGYLRLIKVPFEKGKYTLTCRRLHITRFLRTLRKLGKVCMLTHARRDYAQRMNRAFALGFSEDDIFTLPHGSKAISNRFPSGNSKTILIDDEGPGLDCLWNRRRVYHVYDRHAEGRHAEKCHCLGIEPRSHRDIRYPRFSGLKADLFARPKIRQLITTRITRVTKQLRKKQRLSAESARCGKNNLPQQREGPS